MPSDRISTEMNHLVALTKRLTLSRQERCKDALVIGHKDHTDIIAFTVSDRFMQRDILCT